VSSCCGRASSRRAAGACRPSPSLMQAAVGFSRGADPIGEVWEYAGLVTSLDDEILTTGPAVP